ncbi:DUF6188 family protein [Yinghuangia soli]|uniref:DUF6188 family protein n=1 Tax=Yinghuangia soli TaxID=2908204 RepID=A0AA41U4N8_9ACTN|nr:DUF6188 family protein [Yinghuangia soli]MCF2533130.1 DUF6188 family protein [Yinghuangia soli]
MDQGIVRVDDGWRVPAFRGLGVSQVVVDHELSLRIGSHEIALCTWAELVADQRSYRVAAWPQTNLAKAVELVRQVVAEVEVSDQGTLRVLFADGRRLRVPADDVRSAWTVAVRGQGFLTAKPGGGVQMNDVGSAAGL